MLAFYEEHMKTKCKTLLTAAGMSKLSPMFLKSHREKRKLEAHAKAEAAKAKASKAEAEHEEAELADEEEPGAGSEAEVAAPDDHEKPVEGGAVEGALEPKVSKFEVGQRVRLTVEDLLHKMKFGDDGVVKGVDGSQLQALFERALAATPVPMRLLTAHPEKGFLKAKELSGLQRVSWEAKIGMLREMGFGEPRQDEITPLAVSELLSEQSIDLWATVVRHSLGLLNNERLSYIPPLLSKMILGGSDAVSALAAESIGEVKEKRLRCLDFLYQRGEVVLVPIVSDSGAGHWTLLSITKTDEKPLIEYFDSLTYEDKDCRTRAMRILTLLGLETTGLSRVNMSRQTGVECGFFVCHYLEDKMRCFAGQGPATQGWPGSRMKKLREKLSGWTKILGDDWRKWCEQKNDAAEKEAAFQKAAAEAARKLLEARGMTHKLLEALKAYAGGLLDEGAAGENPPLPEGFGEKPKQKVEAEGKTEEDAAVEEKQAEAEVKKDEEEAEVEDTTAEDAAVEEKSAEADGEKHEEEAETEAKNDEHEAEAEDKHEEEAAVEEKKAEAGKKDGAEAEDKHEEEATVEEKKAEAGKKDGEGEVVESKAEAAKKDDEKVKVPGYHLTPEEHLTVEVAKTGMTVEDLRAEDRPKYLRVRESGRGVCGSCRWSSGCLRCHEGKAWDYYVRQA